jgi:hypothetical protein
LPRTERLSATRRKRAERGIWQRRYWEHTITKELDYAKHIDYIHVNPLKHGYVNRVQDWPYSTFHHYVRDGILVGDYFSDLIRAVDNWYTEISNYFDCRVTNASTECVNKGIARQCRGYKFEVLRARTLFTHAKHKLIQKSFRAGYRQHMDRMPADVAERTIGYSGATRGEFLNYGVTFPHGQGE